MITLARIPLAAALCAAACLATPSPAHAELRALGTEFTYQGELIDLGTPANGNFDLEFRLFDALSGGSQVGPTRTQDATPILDGVFTTRLDFGDQFTGAPRWLQVSVRRTGQPSFTVLAPRQPVSPAPYALHADFVADDSIVGANIVNGSITSVDIAVGGVTSTQIANGGVLTADLADGSVTTAKLGDAAVATAKLADASVTAAKLAPGAVGIAQIDTTQVQPRIVGQCPTGLPLLGFDADGNVVCDDALQYLGEGLANPQLALSARNEPYVLAIDPGARDLVLERCTDPQCSDGVQRLVLDTETGATNIVAIVIRSTGAPFIAYYDQAATALHAFDCVSADCTVNTFRSLDTTGNAGAALGMALRSGNLPVIAYVDNAGTPQLRLFDCDDPGCASGTVRTLDTTDVEGNYRVSVTIAAAGQPVVFYRGSGASVGLNAYVCSNADCTSGTSYDLNDDPDISGIDSITRGAGLPMASYVSGGAVRVFDCSGLICSFGTTRQISATSNSTRASIAFRPGGAPLVAYHDGGGLKVFDCATLFCNSGTANLLFVDFDFNGSPAMALRSDGRPVIASEDESPGGTRRLRLDTCGNEGCRQ